MERWQLYSLEKITLGQLVLHNLRDLATALAIGALVWLPTIVGPFADSGWFSLLLVLMGSQLGLLCVSMPRLVRSHGEDRPSLVPSLGLGFAVALGLIVLGLLYDVMLRLVFGDSTPTLGPWGAIREQGPLVQSVCLLFGVLIGPAAEEAFFRGVMFHSFVEARHVRFGAAFSALLFALLHLDAWNLPAYGVFGLAQAWLRQHSGGLLAPIVAHALVNGAMFALLFSGYR